MCGCAVGAELTVEGEGRVRGPRGQMDSPLGGPHLFLRAKQRTHAMFGAEEGHVFQFLKHLAFKKDPYGFLTENRLRKDQGNS